MVEYNTDQISAMEDEFLKLQKIEIGVDSKNGKTAKVISSYAASVDTYTNQKKLDALIAESEEIIKKIVESGQVRGRVMSLKTMELYLEKSEKVQRSQRLLDLISRQNNKRAQARLSLYIDEMLRDAAILKSDIELFRKRGKIAGLTTKEINRRLAAAATSSSSPVDSFGKRLRTLEKSILRREAVATEIDEYKKVLKPGEKWQWVTISTGPCPDCRIRAGVVLTFDMWQDKGLPGAGATICRDSCMCKLFPVSVSEEMFSEVKTFRWDKESGVLTTFGDMRTFGAEKNKVK